MFMVVHVYESFRQTIARFDLSDTTLERVEFRRKNQQSLRAWKIVADSHKVAPFLTLRNSSAHPRVDHQVGFMRLPSIRKATLALLLATSACASSDGLDGRDSITRIDDEPAGPNCVEGGVLVRTGLDNNEDGILQGDEVTSEAIICDGSDGDPGATYLTATSVEPIGENCSNGGVRVDVGPDDNGDGVLDAEEVVTSEYVCNGADGDQGPAGPAGQPGADGSDGADGADGTNGTNGLDALVAVADEPAGANCADGGIRVTSGSDDNRNGTLDALEVDTTRYVCNGADGADGSSGGGTANPAEVYTTYDPGSVTTSGTGDLTIDSISFTASGAGTAYVVASVDAFCTPSNCASSGATEGYLTLANSATAGAASGNYSFFFLTNDRTENLSRSAVFNVSGAGTQTYYLRGAANSGSIGFFRPQLTVIFFPN
jgi:hypothetical protein